MFGMEWKGIFVSATEKAHTKNTGGARSGFSDLQRVQTRDADRCATSFNHLSPPSPGEKVGRATKQRRDIKDFQKDTLRNA